MITYDVMLVNFATVEVEAESQEEAEKIAIDKAECGDCSLTGWEIVETDPEDCDDDDDERECAMSLNEFRDMCHQRATDKGFSHEQSVQGIIVALALVITEASEAIEAIRRGNVQRGKEEWEKDTMEDEIADILIRVFDFCGAHNIDLDYQVQKKLEYNLNRPYMHGKQV